MAKPTGVKDRILALRMKGFNYNQISERANCAKSTVSYHCQKAGLEDIGYSKGVISEEIQHKIFEYAKTHSIKDTALRFGVSTGTVKKYRKKDVVEQDEDKK